MNKSTEGPGSLLWTSANLISIEKRPKQTDCTLKTSLKICCGIRDVPGKRGKTGDDDKACNMLLPGPNIKSAIQTSTRYVVTF